MLTIQVSENGFFDFDSSSHYWFACLRTLPGGTVGTGRSWRLYSSSASNVEFRKGQTGGDGGAEKERRLQVRVIDNLALVSR